MLERAYLEDPTYVLPHQSSNDTYNLGQCVQTVCYTSIYRHLCLITLLMEYRAVMLHNIIMQRDTN